MNKLPNILFTLGILLAAYIFNNPNEMPRQFSGAYFSGAANIELNADYLISPANRFKIDTSQVYSYSHLQTKDVIFKFSNTRNNISYKHNSLGFAWICKLAIFLFGNFFSPIKSLKCLQILVHLLSCLWLMSLLQSFKQKIVFSLLYAFNPLIMYVVTYPYYYFWTIIPVLILIPYLIKSHFIWGDKLVVLSFIAGLIFASRTVILPLLIILAYFIFKREKRYIGIASVIAVSLSFYFFWSPNQKNLPFTSYIGLGAYTSTILPNMNDEQGFALASSKIESWRFDNCYYQDSFQKSYSNILAVNYLRKAKAYPQLIVRNAILNIGGAFSIGYLNDYNFLLRILSSIIGFAFIFLLIYNRMYNWIAAVFLNCIGFVFYYPPILIYMFSNYLLLVGAFIQLISPGLLISNVRIQQSQLRINHKAIK